MVLNGIPAYSREGGHIKEILNTLAIYECVPCWWHYLIKLV